ncbi:hypothetical protein [Teredinibacter purpureus]|uniref:hypothetical protein n=1 Tax=Teredinibacter purpureus TaxID=2731756 RepID=UPI0005F7DF17|nr:hypothetical protein [Teredinibacter purpureus]
MTKTYLERAKQWVETAEDIDVENIESTIMRFSEELKKNFSFSTHDESKISDLTETISYLRNELNVLAGVEAPPGQDVPVEAANSSYDLDTSPLVDLDVQPIYISPEERARLLLEIKNSPSFISAGQLRSSKRFA